MIAAAHRIHRMDGGPNCKVCRRPSQKAHRIRWGCDEPFVAANSERPAEIFRSTCPRCHGSRDDCETCKGSGVKVWTRCPSSQTDAWSMFVAEVYENLRAHGSWHNGSPWDDQEERLYNAVQIYGSEVMEIERTKQDSERKKAQRSAR